MKVEILKSVGLHPSETFARGVEVDLPKKVAEQWVRAGYAKKVKASK